MDLFELEMPTNLENIQLPSPELLTYYKLQEERIIWLDDDVEQNCIEIARNIHLWNIADKGKPAEERKPIKIFIFSDGGDMNIAYNLLATIEQSITPIWTINTGLACSAAALILIAGDKRFCYNRSLALIHNGSGMVGGTYDQTEAHMKMYKGMVALMHEFILEHTKIDANTFKRKKSQDWFLSAKEQVEYGLVDKIVDSLDEIL